MLGNINWLVVAGLVVIPGIASILVMRQGTR